MTASNPNLRLAVLGLSAAAIAVFVPLWTPLVLAAWTADLVRPMMKLLVRALGGRRALAGAITVGIVLASTLPLVGVAVVIVLRARELVLAVLRSLAAGGPIAETLGITEPGRGLALEPRVVLDLVRQHGATAWRLIGSVATASASAFFALVVFALALFAFSVDGARIYGWFARRTPLDRDTFRRLVGAFRETGRGLLVGAGGTAAAQAIVATIAYASLGVADAITLGVLTGAFSFMPGVGTALVWVPVAVALSVTGHPVRALVLVALGIGVIGTVDNVLRPWLARVGSLRLPMIVVFVSMAGAVRLFGGWGLLVGPLLVRLAVEAHAIARERRAGAEADPRP